MLISLPCSFQSTRTFGTHEWFIEQTSTTTGVHIEESKEKHGGNVRVGNDIKIQQEKEEGRDGLLPSNAVPAALGSSLSSTVVTAALAACLPERQP